ncbi:MAG: sulfurtransferase [Gammaproteobacteria bacterium]
MSASPLIDARELAGLLGQPDVRIIDCRFTLSEPDAGRRGYERAHIPGASYAHLDDDLAGDVTDTSGRHPLPAPAQFARTLGDWGVTPQTLVVAYDEGPGAVASRLWWLLGWVGHERRRVLDGGLAAWRQQGLPLDAGKDSRGTHGAPYPVDPDREREVDAAGVIAALQAGAAVLDARARERFIGLKEPIDAVAGHIPGALNHPFTENVGDDGCLLAPAELARRYRARLAHYPGKPIAMCGSGVTACHISLAMAVAGLPEPRLYVGSWSHWIRDAERPIASGAD